MPKASGSCEFPYSLSATNLLMDVFGKPCCQESGRILQFVLNDAFEEGKGQLQRNSNRGNQKRKEVQIMDSSCLDLESKDLESKPLESVKFKEDTWASLQRLPL